MPGGGRGGSPTVLCSPGGGPRPCRNCDWAVGRSSDGECGVSATGHGGAGGGALVDPGTRVDQGEDGDGVLRRAIRAGMFDLHVSIRFFVNGCARICIYVCVFACVSMHECMVVGSYVCV